MSRTLAEIFGLLVGEDAPVGFRGYDGSAVERSGAVGWLPRRAAAAGLSG